MSLYFITGNKNKFAEVQSFFPEIEQLDIDLPEIQEISAKKIIEQKLIAAEAHGKSEYIVEDTSFYLDCLGGALPGPLIKWFEKAIGIADIAALAEKMGNTGATAKTIIGYADASGIMHFFEGTLRGTIVSPTGDKDFGWGPIFKPEGHEKTFGEMAREEKHAIGMRGIAIGKLKYFLKR
ncbi:MAG: non-canonical purine NTP pyrophosphatase [Candidatus Sungbacteria bacterium]|nr:non-canonical purine NTP pyrophosphatase [Candidatus Sungbacteria bacterium]